MLTQKDIERSDLRKDIAPPIGSTNMVFEKYCKDLNSTKERRNFDRSLLTVLYKYCRPNRKSSIKEEVKYLKTLKSLKDGRLFSQGYFDLKKFLESAEKFAEDNHADFRWSRAFKRAYAVLEKEFRSVSLTPLEYRDVDDIRGNLPKLSTNAGFYGFMNSTKDNRKTAKGDNLDTIYNDLERILDQLHQGKRLDRPIVPSYRTQGKGHAYDPFGVPTGDCDHKTRIVMMVDLIVIVLELMYAKPIQEFMANTKWYAGGKDLEFEVGNLIFKYLRRNWNWVSLDYSSFDSSISDWLIQACFDLIKSAFISVDESVFEAIRFQFINKRIIISPEKVIYSHKGVPSGSMFTQIVDSIANRLIVLTYFAHLEEQGKLSRKLEDIDMLIMGDDNLVFQKFDVSDFVSYCQHNFGVMINAEKTAEMGKEDNPYPDQPQFLSRYWLYSGTWKEPHEMISKMLYPERFRKYGIKPEGSTIKTTPQMVFYGYMLCYSKTMSDWFDTGRFLSDYPNLSNLRLEDFKDRQILPGSVEYRLSYAS